MLSSSGVCCCRPQEISVVTAIHNIHDHPSVAMSAMRALHRRGEGRYIDTDALQTSLRHSSDALAVRPNQILSPVSS